METMLKIRDICKEHHSCYDNCPFHVDNECVLMIPPSNWSDEQLYLISKALKGDEDERAVKSIEKETRGKLVSTVSTSQMKNTMQITQLLLALYLGVAAQNVSVTSHRQILIQRLLVGVR